LKLLLYSYVFSFTFFYFEQKSTMYKFLLITTLLIPFFPINPSLAQDEIRQEHVQFKPGTSGTTIQGQIQGYETVDYILRANAGQSMSVILKTDNTQNYFNVIAPGEDTAIFVGSTSGNSFQGTLPKDGEYIIRVYIMRAAARREETANFTMDVQINNNQASSGDNPTYPYTTANYDATTILSCEVRQSVDMTIPVTHNQDCPAGILRQASGFATISIMLPSGVERVLTFEPENVTTPNGGDLNWSKENDTWYIGINDQEFYLVPDAAIYGD
jgi:hypothetical protein